MSEGLPVSTARGARLRLRCSALAAIILMPLGAVLVAQESTRPVVSYQGFLTTPAGEPLNGDHAITFRLYELAGAGPSLWEETHGRVSIRGGHFIVLLGSIAPLADAEDLRGFDRPLFLGVAIDGGEELQPRLPLTALPVAMQSRGAPAAVAVDCGAGESISSAINAAAPGGRLTVSVTGSCTENLVIQRDHVILDGAGTATLTGVSPSTHVGNAVVFLDGVRGVEIRGLALRGAPGDTAGMHGVLLDHVSSGRISAGSVIEGHAGEGVMVAARSQLDIVDAVVRDNDGNGLHVKAGSDVDVMSTIIRDNRRSGAVVGQHSSGSFTSSTVVDNGAGVESAGTCKCALHVDNGSAVTVHHDNTFRSGVATASIGAAVMASGGSTLRIANGPVLVENTAFEPGMRDGSAGLALAAYDRSVVSVSTPVTVSIRGAVTNDNLSHIDLRNVAVEGHLIVGETSSHIALRDQSGVPSRVSLLGDFIFLADSVRLGSREPVTQIALIDGNVDCRGHAVDDPVQFREPEDGYVDCPRVATDLATSILESVDPVSAGGTVSYAVTVSNVKRSPAVEARSVVLDVVVRSVGAFTIDAASAATSPSAGTCAIDDAGSFDGSEFVGLVSCSYDAVRLADAVADITVSTVLAALDVEAGASAVNGDVAAGNDTATESTEVQ